MDDIPLVFDFTNALLKHTKSPNTQRVYYRWIDQFLADITQMKRTQGGDARAHRMANLPVKPLKQILTPELLSDWLDTLAEAGHGKQGIDQARSAVIVLADLMSQSRQFPKKTVDALKKIPTPEVEVAPKKDARLLSRDELMQLIRAAEEIATSPNQQLRNTIMATMLCTMALRREELSVAKWGDLKMVDEKKVILQTDQDYAIEVPSNLLNPLSQWRNNIGKPSTQSPIVRRLWKGGRIAKEGLSPDGVWLVIRDAAEYANLGHVTPDDLRRSIAGGLRDAGVSVEKISQILRHRSLIITERYLRRIPSVENES